MMHSKKKGLRFKCNFVTYTLWKIIFKLSLDNLEFMKKSKKLLGVFKGRFGIYTRPGPPKVGHKLQWGVGHKADI